MDYKETLYGFKRQRERVIEYSKRLMLTRMVCDNIKDLLGLIGKDWEVQPVGNTSFKIKPLHNDKITVETFDKLTTKFARIFRKEPYMYINKEIMQSEFYVYTGYNENFVHDSVSIEIEVGNTEKCDITIVQKMVDVSELTGYCKVLAEKRFLQETN